MAEQASAAEVAIRAAIEELYRVFARYRFRPGMPYCTCCHADIDVQRLGAKPLRELMPDELGRFATDALLLWGTNYDYRHFLPRMFEIVSSEGFNWPDAEVVLGRLRKAGWPHWPQDEREAVHDYLATLWRWHLSQYDPSLNIIRGSILCSLGQAEDDLSPYLRVWDEEQGLPATMHIADEVIMSEYSLCDSQLAEPFWEDRPEQRQQVVDWLRRPQTLQRLERACLEATEDEWATDLGRAFDILATLAQQK